MKIGLESNLIRALLKNVYFITGTAYARKSTMVRLLAEKYDGICCGENYHDALMGLIDREHQPNLSYFETMSGWQEFIGRTPEEYDAWITGCSEEAAGLELLQLIRLSVGEKKIFADTNIPLSVLREIGDYHRVAVLLSPQSMSVERFFDREDAEKQFLYRQIQQAPDPVQAMENYKNCVAEINSPAHYREYEESGFYTCLRREDSTIPEVLEKLERHFQLRQAG